MKIGIFLGNIINIRFDHILLISKSKIEYDSGKSTKFTLRSPLAGPLVIAKQVSYLVIIIKQCLPRHEIPAVSNLPTSFQGVSSEFLLDR